MVSSSAWALARLIGWSFLPDYIARTVFALYHRIRLKLLPALGIEPAPPPQPNTYAHVQQQRISFAVVIMGYLIWTTTQAYITTPPSLYQILKVPPNADEQTMKVAFRTFARYNHPDKVGQSGEALFIVVRDAFEALKHPVKRFAYDRFGQEALTWAAHCQTPRDYLMNGLMAASGFYIGTGLVMTLLALFGRNGGGTFWRYAFFGTLGALELRIILADTPWILTLLLPNRLPFQHILFLHQLFISASIAIARIVPVLVPSLGPSRDPAEQAKEVNLWAKPVAEKLVMLSQLAEKEVSRMLAAELRAMHGVDPSRLSTRTEQPMVYPGGASPLKPSTLIPSSQASQPNLASSESEAVMKRLLHEMENMIMDKNIRGHPMLRSIWEQVITRKWQEMNDADTQNPIHPDAPSSPIRAVLGFPRQRQDSLLPSPPASINTLPRGEMSPTPDVGTPPPRLPTTISLPQSPLSPRSPLKPELPPSPFNAPIDLTESILHVENMVALPAEIS